MKNAFTGLLFLFISCSEVSNGRPGLKDAAEAKHGVNNKLIIPEISLQTFNQLPKDMEVGNVMYYFNQHKSRSYIFLSNRVIAFVKVNGKLILLKRTKESKKAAELFEEYKGGGVKATIKVKKQLVYNGALQYTGTLNVTNGFKKVSVPIYAKVNDIGSFKN